MYIYYIHIFIYIFLILNIKICVEKEFLAELVSTSMPAKDGFEVLFIIKKLYEKKNFI